MGILCGPIIRHVSAKEVHVFLAIDNPDSQLRLQLFEDQGKTKKANKQSKAQLFRLGNQCAAALVTTKISQGCEAETLYYDILLDGKTLSDQGLTEKVCLGSDLLPSFLRPVKHTRILQASCRKPHTEGRVDQLGHASTLLERNLRTPERPSQLFLTGDQIYADDVSPLFIPWAEQIAEVLGFPNEKVVKDDGKQIDLARRKIDARNELLKKKFGFTSTESGSHLVKFHEYAAMYLLAFGGEEALRNKYGIRFPDYESLEPRLRRKYETIRRHGRSTRRRKVTPFSKSEYEKHKKSLARFCRSSNSGVRKLFANISVYTMFDDHEVTDDWNISIDNQERLRSSALGRKVQTNALTAYFLFQHIGNQPEDYELSSDIRKYIRDPSEDHESQLSPMFTKDWGYILDQEPPVVVVDTRTGRKFYDKSRLALISPRRISKLSDQLSKLGSHTTAILVSPTPVFGYDKIEAVQKFYRIFKTSIDREGWSQDPFAVDMLLTAFEKISDLESLVIFSGDVHYSFARYEPEERHGFKSFQLCSSPVCNEPTGPNNALKWFNILARDLADSDVKYLAPSQRGSGRDSSYFLNWNNNYALLSLDHELQPLECRMFDVKDGRQGVFKYDLRNLKFAEV